MRLAQRQGARAPAGLTASGAGMAKAVLNPVGVGQGERCRQRGGKAGRCAKPAAGCGRKPGVCESVALSHVFLGHRLYSSSLCDPSNVTGSLQGRGHKKVPVICPGIPSWGQGKVGRRLPGGQQFLTDSFVDNIFGTPIMCLVLDVREFWHSF